VIRFTPVTPTSLAAAAVSSGRAVCGHFLLFWQRLASEVRRRPAEEMGWAVAGRVLRRGEAARCYSARGSVMLFKALAEQDDGDFSLMERTLPPAGRRPPPHRHGNCSEGCW
jgi:hypothetical protein